jgi:hypothetical protein
MVRRPGKLVLFALLSLALLGQACAFARPPAAQTLPSATSTEVVSSDVPTAYAALPTTTSIIVRTVPAPTLVPTPVPPPVSIKAVDGDLAIRKGPDEVFDAVDKLKAGDTLPVHARSIQDGWLQVPIPSQPGAFGWVSTKAGYSEVDGNVLDLPLITAVEWPFGGYVLNCTAHNLLAKPGDKPIPAVSPDGSNRVWFFPGLYTVYDVDVADQPAVTQVKLYEHTTVSIISDGAHNKYTCP